jgi:hypothetical protein
MYCISNIRWTHIILSFKKGNLINAHKLLAYAIKTSPLKTIVPIDKIIITNCWPSFLPAYTVAFMIVAQILFILDRMFITRYIINSKKILFKNISILNLIILITLISMIYVVNMNHDDFKIINILNYYAKKYIDLNVNLTEVIYVVLSVFPVYILSAIIITLTNRIGHSEAIGRISMWISAIFIFSKVFVYYFEDIQLLLLSTGIMQFSLVLCCVILLKRIHYFKSLERK